MTMKEKLASTSWPYLIKLLKTLSLGMNRKRKGEQTKMKQ